MELMILGLIVLFIYAFIRLLASFSAGWRVPDTGPTASLPADSTAATRAGASATRPRSASSTTGRPSGWAWLPRSPGSPSIRGRASSRGSGGGSRSASSSPRPRAPPRPRRPRGPGRSGPASPSSTAYFVVQANDPEMARDFLNPQVRWAIANLQRLVHPGGMLVSINPERLLVQIDRNLGPAPEALIQAVSESLVIHDGLQVGVSRQMTEGISIVDNPELAEEDGGPPICKVCGEAISGGPVVVCSSCRTPHHRECWEYVGACSIYGCGCKLASRSTASSRPDRTRPWPSRPAGLAS